MHAPRPESKAPQTRGILRRIPSMSITQRRRSRWWAHLLPVITVICFFMTATALAATDSEQCAACHDDVVAAFSQTGHGVYLAGGAEEYDCSSCHGSGEAHAQEGDPSLITNPANHDQFEGRATCLSCHRGEHFDDWDFSAHRDAGVTCADCHEVHAAAGRSLKKTVPELCYDCHGDVRAAAYMPSHHPIAEGKITCQDCHNVHGGSVDLAMNDDQRELCFTCHADKEGPFLFEHAPVNEDCGLCHTPHGSVAENLLKESEPTLCLSCHAMHFHATITGVDGRFVPPTAPERAAYSTRDAWKRGMLTKCTQCHTEIHGSDLPSQSISGQGGALTR
jgi:DmsE family decaheme c-type cytochrome